MAWGWRESRPKRAQALRDNVGQHHAFKFRDGVFQEKLTLFQSVKTQEVDRKATRQLVDHDVKVAVLGFERLKAAQQVFFFFGQHHGHAGESDRKNIITGKRGYYKKYFML